MKDGTPSAKLPVGIPLGMMNRHGLIAGSTGTGKTRSLSGKREDPRSRNAAASVTAADEAEPQRAGARTATPKPEKSAFEEVMGSSMAQNVARQAARTVTQQVIREILGMLKGR